MKMRCFCLCLELCLNLSWFEFEKVCQSSGLEVPCWGSIEINKCFVRTACSSAKKVYILNMLAGTKRVSGHLFARTRLVVLARNLVFDIPWGNLSQVCSKQTSSTGTLGSTPERTQVVVRARNSFSTKHQFKHTSLQKDQLCADTIVCVFNKTWTHSKLQKVFSSTLAAKICRTLWVQEATTFCHSQHANALFSKRIGYINQF